MAYTSHIYHEHQGTMYGGNSPYLSPTPAHGQDSYAITNPLIVGSGMHSGHQLPGNPVSPLDDAEEVDTSSRPRLTQDQIAVLEKNFTEKQKPGTEFKKRLAVQIGLSLQRVNNWYQNRRAKARHQRPQEQSFNVVPVESSAPWVPPDMSFPEYQNAAHYQLPEIGSLPDEASFAYFFIDPNNDDLTRSTTRYSPVLGRNTSAVESARILDDFSTVKHDDDFSPDPGSIYLKGNNAAISMPAIPDYDLHEWAKEAQLDTNYQNDNPIAFEAPPDAFAQPMYQNSVDGYLTGNPSCQTFASTSSSDSEQPDFMTPPPRTSPLPVMAQDCSGRRGSVTSDLASTFDTIRLQRQQSNRGLYDEIFHPQAAPRLATVIGDSPGIPWLPMGINDALPAQNHEKATGEPQALARPDLASRRKRPRPAAIKPNAEPLVRADGRSDTHRSQSYAGPMTTSPSTKPPQLNVTPSQSVRRMKSTPGHLNVMSGRIQKPSQMLGQMSPRNFQACFGGNLMEDGRRRNISASQLSGLRNSPPTPPSPANVEVPKQNWPSSWEPTYDYSTPTGFSTALSITSPPVTPFNVDNFPQALPDRYQRGFPQFHQSTYDRPPQSAPPQQTTFFGGSPLIPAAGANPCDWPIQMLDNHAGVAPMNRQQTYIPRYGYYDNPASFATQHQQYYPTPPDTEYCQPTLYGNASPAPKALDIQISVIPAPEGPPQPKKEYVFHHATPEDFTPTI